MEYILSLSYGKDSLACFGACEILGWPIDRVVTAEVWATDTLPADLPPIVDLRTTQTGSSRSGGGLRWSISDAGTLTRICFTVERARWQRKTQGKSEAGR